MEVRVAEAPEQVAVFRCPLPKTEEDLALIEERKLRSRQPCPCLKTEEADP